MFNAWLIRADCARQIFRVHRTSHRRGNDPRSGMRWLSFAIRAINESCRDPVIPK
jgi:hypothetical protein